MRGINPTAVSGWCCRMLRFVVLINCATFNDNRGRTLREMAAAVREILPDYPRYWRVQAVSSASKLTNFTKCSFRLQPKSTTIRIWYALFAPPRLFNNLGFGVFLRLAAVGLMYPVGRKHRAVVSFFFTKVEAGLPREQRDRKCLEPLAHVSVSAAVLHRTYFAQHSMFHAED